MPCLQDQPNCFSLSLISTAAATAHGLDGKGDAHRNILILEVSLCFFIPQYKLVLFFLIVYLLLKM